MEEKINRMSLAFISSMHNTLGKEKLSHEVHGDPSLQIIIHMISCTQYLRDLFENSRKTKNNLSAQIYQPFLNGVLALFGKILMDSFSSEPKVGDIDRITQAFSVIGKHILNLFPDMTSKRHKSSGKMLIHHAVFKARPAIAEEAVNHILAISPECARVTDAAGALPLHWAVRNQEVAFGVLNVLIKAYPESPTIVDKKGFLPIHWGVNQDQPNVEVIRHLLKLYPAGAAAASQSGNLPLHICVNREKPSPAIIKALMNVYPEGIHVADEEGYLPIHRFVNRENLDLDILKLMIHYFPESLQKTTKVRTIRQ
jgi:hypothetical protein